MTYRQAIHDALGDLLEKHPEVILLGQSIRDPFGGCCKVTRSLTTQFPDRIIDTPICEAAMVGTAIGLSMQGFIPIIEIMFSNFLTLCTDQFENVTKIIHEHHQPIKIIVRTIYNAPKEYGPTHSGEYRPNGTIARFYPDLGVDFKWLYGYFLTTQAPSLIIIYEDKQLYDKQMKGDCHD